MKRDQIFKIIWSDGPNSLAQCLACKKEFDVDACTEDGLYLASDKVLYMECPNCNIRESPSGTSFVYLVTSGQYSDYSINGVYSSFQLARNSVPMTKTFRSATPQNWNGHRQWTYDYPPHRDGDLNEPTWIQEWPVDAK